MNDWQRQTVFLIATAALAVMFVSFVRMTNAPIPKDVVVKAKAACGGGTPYFPQGGFGMPLRVTAADSRSEAYVVKCVTASHATLSTKIVDPS